MSLTVYGADWCADCIRTKRQLDELGVDYEYLDVAADATLAETAREISGRTNIPVVVYPDGSHQVEPSNADVAGKLAELGIGGVAVTRTPGTPLDVSAADLVSEADAQVEAIGVDEARALLDDPGWLFVDLRDPRELARLGTIPGAHRAPRGMLEFWVDPQSPYHRPVLDDGRRLLLYCGSGWRSALAAATLQRMGRDDVAHLRGGFTAWQEAGHPVEAYEGRAAQA